MASSVKVHLFEEVIKHNNKNDCWVIISGKVYDVTSFLDDHPGGDEVVLSATGRDATTDFEDVGHSETAIEMMEKFCIGKIDSTTLPTKQGLNIPGKTIPQADQSSGLAIKILQFLVPLLTLGLALAIRQFIKKE